MKVREIPNGSDGEMDEASALDRLWFESHPDAVFRYRRPTDQERRLGAERGAHVTRVKVTKVAGGRVREFIEGGAK